MKLTKRILICLLSACMLLSCGAAAAEESDGTYEIAYFNSVLKGLLQKRKGPFCTPLFFTAAKR